MVKVSSESQLEGKVAGSASGKRSAIIDVKMADGTEKMIRLKGCGNEDQGFIDQNYLVTIHKDKAVGSKEIRGCQFENSTYRESYLQNKVNQILSENGLVGANKPIGFWKYSGGDTPEEAWRWSEVGVANPYPLQI